MTQYAPEPSAVSRYSYGAIRSNLATIGNVTSASGVSIWLSTWQNFKLPGKQSPSGDPPSRSANVQTRRRPFGRKSFPAEFPQLLSVRRLQGTNALVEC